MPPREGSSSLAMRGERACPQGWVMWVVAAFSWKTVDGAAAPSHVWSGRGHRSHSGYPERCPRPAGPPARQMAVLYIQWETADLEMGSFWISSLPRVALSTGSNAIHHRDKDYYYQLTGVGPTAARCHLIAIKSWHPNLIWSSRQFTIGLCMFIMMDGTGSWGSTSNITSCHPVSITHTHTHTHTHTYWINRPQSPNV